VTLSGSGPFAELRSSHLAATAASLVSSSEFALKSVGVMAAVEALIKHDKTRNKIRHT
jgi:hypothetical protein